ncbi:uncharacterized protein LOC134738342 isoform X2 [Pongo pygmaeus]|uniref:uncharacterized protein LOC134738342 isoform X2 n=1 Tax=Pongo pygmaeus TaxID=9600 RepID=UPI00300CE284
MTAGSAAIADWMEMEEGRRGGPGLGLSEEGGKMEDGLDVAEDWLWVWTQGTHWLWSRPGSHAGSGRPSRSSESPGSLLEMPVLSLCPRSTELEFSLWLPRTPGFKLCYLSMPRHTLHTTTVEPKYLDQGAGLI